MKKVIIVFFAISIYLLGNQLQWDCTDKVFKLNYEFEKASKLQNPKKIDKLQDLLNTVYEVSGECKSTDVNKDFDLDGDNFFGTDNLKIVIKKIIKGEDSSANQMSEKLASKEGPSMMIEGKFISFNNYGNRKSGTFEIKGEKINLMLLLNSPERLKNHKNEILSLKYDPEDRVLYDFYIKVNTSSKGINTTNTNSSQTNIYTLKNLRKDMNYSKAREIILNIGWQGNDIRWQDVPQYGQTNNVYYNNGWHEVASCLPTGTASCRFEFKDIHQRTLVVITEGECLTSNNEYPKKGEKCELFVSRWFFEQSRNIDNERFDYKQNQNGMSYEKDNSIKNDLMQSIENMYNELYNKGIGKKYAERTASAFMVEFYLGLYSKSIDNKECIKSTEKYLYQVNNGYMPMITGFNWLHSQQLLLNKYCGNPDGLKVWYQKNMIDEWNDKHEIKIEGKHLVAAFNEHTAMTKALKEKNAKQAERFKELNAYHRKARTVADGGKLLTYAEQRKIDEAKNAEARQKQLKGINIYSPNKFENVEFNKNEEMALAWSYNVPISAFPFIQGPKDAQDAAKRYLEVQSK